MRVDYLMVTRKIPSSYYGSRPSITPLRGEHGALSATTATQTVEVEVPIDSVGDYVVRDRDTDGETMPALTKAIGGPYMTQEVQLDCGLS